MREVKEFTIVIVHCAVEKQVLNVEIQDVKK